LGGKGKKRGEVTKGLDPDLEEDVDRFVARRSKDMFGEDEDVTKESEDEEEMIMGVGDDDDDDDEEEEEEEDDDDDAGVGLASDLDDEEDEVKEEGWGKNRSDYYDADEADDSEAEEEEEKEALRLRAKQSALLKAEDFGEDEVASSDEDDTIAAALSDRGRAGKGKDKPSAKDKQKAKVKDKKKAAKPKGAIALDEELDALEEDDGQVEKVERDLSGLSEKERLAILENDSPELLVLLGDFARYIKEVRAQLLPVRERVKAGGLPTASGVSYLEVKLQLLLSYCTNVAFYLLLKAEGRSVKSHPVIEQLVELRTLMEKMRPLDAKLKYQMDKLLKTPLAGAAAAGDALRFKPNPDALLDGGTAAAAGADDDDGGEAGGGGGGADGGDVYRPPRITAMHFEDKEEARARRAREKKAARARKSEIVQALREEFDDAPAEEPNIGSAAQYRDKEEDHRTRFEEDNFVRVAVPKKERARLAALRRGGGGDAFESFEDFGDIDLAVGRDEDRAAVGVLRKRSLEEYVASQESDRRARARKDASGERDVPVRDRRAVIAAVEQRKQAAAARRERGGRGGGGDSGSDGGGAAGEEDEFYQQVAASKAAEKQARKGLYERSPKAYREEEGVEEGGRREAGRAIEKNRGLVPHRSRDKKNPRVRHRIKFDKAKTKERTSFYGKQARPDRAGYAGEATGIKPNIARSRKL
jgi:U3 small nucleolar RNA-associated protein 3